MKGRREGILTLVLAIFCGFAFSLKAQTLDFVLELKDEVEFEALAGDPLTEKYGQVSSIKIVWEESSNKLFYTNSKKYRLHIDFCQKQLKYFKSAYLFNQANYSDNPRRQFILANINHYIARDIWTLEFSSADLIGEEWAWKTLEYVEKTSFLAGKIRLLLNTQRLRSAIDLPSAGRWKDKYILPDEIYANLSYQPLNCKRGYGYLRRIKVEDLEDEPPGPTDIVVLDGPALDIPAVAGLISPDFQTPLSHLSILCKNRGTPYLAQKGIWESPKIKEMEGQLVMLEVGNDSFKLEPAQLNEAQKFWAYHQARKKQKLARDLKTMGLVDLGNPRMAKTSVVGGKASNFAFLMSLSSKPGFDFKVPEGAFAIPFYWYERHFQAAGCSSLLDSILNMPALRSDQQQVSKLLKEMRARIKNQAVDPQLLALVEAQVKANGGFERMRFRSSTNAEDIEGFNGAGLYGSYTGILADSSKSFEQAIRKVWASAWNLRAFREREYFGIVQNTVAMGILVHRSFPTEEVNGVAITKNLYRPESPGIVINVQIGETSVVSPPPGVDCDQLICFSGSDLEFYKGRDIVEYLTYSNLNHGQPVMNSEEVVHLSQQLAMIQKAYLQSFGLEISPNVSLDQALDFEFKLDGAQRQLYIKQMRPYND